jgi:hypothetical protein
MILKEFDTVESVVEISSLVSIGTIGVVVMCYDEEDYEVEFVDINNQTIEVVTVSKEKIKKVSL